MPIPIDIVIPEKVVLQTHVDSVVVPAVDGEIGILPHHAPLLAQLQPGQIRLTVDGHTQLFAVSGGFVEVRSNQVKIFAETAEMAAEIDVERARQAAERAKAALKAARQDIDIAQAEAALRRAIARLRVSEEIRRQKTYPSHS